MAVSKTEDVPVGDDAEEVSNYKPPAEKTVKEIMEQDSGDKALDRYKEVLLGASPNAVVFAEDPRYVIVNKLGLMVEGRPDEEMDLTDLKNLQKRVFRLKEGTHYRIKIYFYVQREIVSGLRYIQKTTRKGVGLDKTAHMVGSYGPKTELQSFVTPQEEAPSGMLYRGEYGIKSLFTDDDKNEHLKWEWTIKISKDWE